MAATLLATASSVVAIVLAVAIAVLWRLYTQSVQRTDEALASVREERARADERREALRRYELAFASISGRGELGEQVLVETARALGLRQGVHFVLQADVAGGGAARPDMVLTVGGERQVPVDAKMSITCWAEAMETQDADERHEALRVHARNIRSRAAELAGKQYQRWADGIYGTIMFVPSDAAVVAALDTDTELLRWLIDRRVFLCGPTGFGVVASAAMFAATESALSADLDRLRDQAVSAHRSASAAVDAVNLSSTHLQRFLSARRRELDALEGFRAAVTPLAEAAGTAKPVAEVRRNDEHALEQVPGSAPDGNAAGQATTGTGTAGTGTAGKGATME